MPAPVVDRAWSARLRRGTKARLAIREIYDMPFACDVGPRPDPRQGAPLLIDGQT